MSVINTVGGRLPLMCIHLALVMALLLGSAWLESPEKSLANNSALPKRQQQQQSKAFGDPLADKRRSPATTIFTTTTFKTLSPPATNIDDNHQAKAAVRVLGQMPATIFGANIDSRSPQRPYSPARSSATATATASEDLEPLLASNGGSLGGSDDNDDEIDNDEIEYESLKGTKTNNEISGSSSSDKSTARGLFSNFLQMNETAAALDKIRDRYFSHLNFSGRNFTRRDCLLCRFSASLLQYAVQTKKGEEKVESVARNFCLRAKWESDEVCQQVVSTFKNEVVKVLAYGLFTPDQICGLLSDNHCGHFTDPFGEWSVSLEASQHLDLDLLHEYGINEKAHHLDTRQRSQTKPYKVIHISDTHVDLNYLPGTLSHCDEPLCCQATSNRLSGLLNRIDAVMESDNGFQRGWNLKRETGLPDLDQRSGYWGTYAHCDIPLRTLEQLLIKLNETISSDPDISYIIWTGDIQPHDIWKQNRESARRTYEAVFDKINQYLPNIKIYPTLGNHEMVPVDSFSPSNMFNIAGDDSPKWLFRKMDRYWSRWLPESTQATILKDGNYAAIVRPGLKIVSLDTNYCNNKNFWLFINATDPGNQLQWLVHELQLSELLQEKVHIIGHIPPGAEDCLRVWSKNFNRIIRRFKRTVTSQFYGHTHNNEFQIFYDLDSMAEAAKSPSSKTTKTKNKNIDQEATNTTMNTIERETTMIPDDASGNELETNDIESQLRVGSTRRRSSYLDMPLLANSEPTNEEMLAAARLAMAEPISVGFIGPSTTTFIGLNPSFRIYTVNPLQGFLPVDFDTYYMNLTKANNNLPPDVNLTLIAVDNNLLMQSLALESDDNKTSIQVDTTLNTNLTVVVPDALVLRQSEISLVTNTTSDLSSLVNNSSSAFATTTNTTTITNKIKATDTTNTKLTNTKINDTTINNSNTTTTTTKKKRKSKQQATGAPGASTTNLPASFTNDMNVPATVPQTPQVFKLEWVHGGSFAQTFNIPDVSPMSLHRLICNLAKSIDIKEDMSESLRSLLKRVFLQEQQNRDQENYILDETSKASQQADALYKLYRLFYGFSDVFGPEQYAKCDDECRKLFLCRFLTGESHNSIFCLKYIRARRELMSLSP